MLQYFIHKTISTRLWFTVDNCSNPHETQKMAGLCPGFSSIFSCRQCKISRACMSVRDPENISCINYAKSKDQRKIRRNQLKMGDLQNK